MAGGDSTLVRPLGKIDSSGLRASKSVVWAQDLWFRPRGSHQECSPSRSRGARRELDHVERMTSRRPSDEDVAFQSTCREQLIFSFRKGPAFRVNIVLTVHYSQAALIALYQQCVHLEQQKFTVSALSH